MKVTTGGVSLLSKPVLHTTPNMLATLLGRPPIYIPTDTRTVFWYLQQLVLIIWPELWESEWVGSALHVMEIWYCLRQLHTDSIIEYRCLNTTQCINCISSILCRVYTCRLRLRVLTHTNHLSSQLVRENQQNLTSWTIQYCSSELLNAESCDIYFERY